MPSTSSRLTSSGSRTAWRRSIGTPSTTSGCTSRSAFCRPSARRLRRQPIPARLGDQDLRAGGVGFDLLAQAVDVGFQRVGGDAGVVTPHLGQQLLAGDYLAPGAVEVLEDVGFLVGQPDLLAL